MRLVLAVVLALLLPVPPAAAVSLGQGDQPVPLGAWYQVLEDRAGTLTLEDARAAAAAGRFRPVHGGEDPNFGYSTATFWLRVPLENHLPEASRWLLEVPFPTLDSVRIHLVDSASGALLARQEAGDRVPFAERPYPHRHFVFPITLPPHRPLALYLRVASAGSLTVGATLWPPERFSVASRDAYLALTLYFGVLVALFAYNLLLFLSLRDRAYLYYVLFVGSMAVGQGAWNGLFYEYLWPGAPAWANVAAVVGFNATGLFGALFSRVFLGARRQVPALDRVMRWCAAMFAALILALPLVPYQVIAVATSVTGVTFSLVAVASGVVCLRRGYLPARYFLLAWTLLLAGTAALGARNLGWLPTNFLTLHAMQIGSALEMLLLSFALAERIHQLRAQKEAAEADAMQARRMVVETLARTERDLEHQVAARTRELSELNRSLHQQHGLLERQALRDSLTGVANRTQLDVRLGARLADGDGLVGVLFIDLDDFKTVNDTYGHWLGDRLLQVVARRLECSVRSIDTVARLGGDEFVVVLGRMQSAEALLGVGEKIIAQLGQPVTIEGLQLRVSCSIGAALAPDDGTEPATVIKHADRAMYEAKRGGANHISPALGLSRRLARAAAPAATGEPAAEGIPG
ncbi:7TM diverse intracellular signaling domain-containing protein [Thioalbus denitrificans]|uniref:Diguanylate cyclase (GGDEF)-like protein n=1 Tax=Thioalbus denitrificans TaxID=547122 RepID=A0A369BN28_9GAMM|nr:7TM diverse intracellular signaling domain-containing protein [Thioalbus denitrificans]RCX22006.1 diguanylate cyclase (GGDEF)-like protein [Thioalbus denitrificans]